MSSTLLLTATLVLAAQEPGTVIVPPPPPVSGVVVDEQGQPVVRAEVFRIGLGGRLEWSRSVLWKGETDGHGRFTIDRGWGVTDGAIPVFDGNEYVIVVKPGMQFTGHRLPDWSAPGGAPAPTRIALRRSASVRVRILDPDRLPIEGAIVKAGFGELGMELPGPLGDALVGTTDADGRATLPAAENNGTFYITTPRLGKQVVRSGDRGDGEKVLELRATGRLTGRVVADDAEVTRGLRFAGGTAPAGRRVPTGPRGSIDAVTGTEGRFDVPAIAVGALYGNVEVPERYVVAQRPQARLAIEAGKKAEIAFVLKRGVRVRGMLRERGTGRPIVHAVANIGDASFNTPAKRFRTGADGRFEVFLQPGANRFVPVYVGTYVLVDGTRNTTVTIPEGVESFDLPPVELVRGVELKVAVRDAAGKPVAGACVDAMFADGRNVPSGSNGLNNRVSDDLGQFVLGPVPPDRKIELIAWRDDMASGPPVPVLPGMPQSVTLVISRDNTMTLGGRAVDEYGKPIAGAEVSITSRHRTSLGAEVTRYHSGILTQMRWNLRTDADGRFQTPRQLLRFEEQRAWAEADGRGLADTGWFAPTTPSFFDITLCPVSPPVQNEIRTKFDAGWKAYDKGDYATAEQLFQTAVDEAEKRGVTEPLSGPGTK